MFYQEIILSIFAISWFSERIYFYTIHNNNNTPEGLLNLSAPLASSYNTQYNPVTIPESSNENSQLNDDENQSHL